MKFTIERNPFIKALAHISAIVERRNTIAILSNIKIDAHPNYITLTATDLDMFATETVQEFNVNETGTITVPASLIHDIAKKMPDGANISIELKDGKLIVKAGRSRFVLPTIPSDDFPAFPNQDYQATFTIEGTKLADAINATRFAMSSEETRYYLNGLFWHSRDGLTIAATDGHRLATHNLPIHDTIPDIIVPRKAVNEVAKLVDGGNVTIDVSAHRIRFTIGHIVIASKLIDGTFPDYTRVIPKGNPHALNIDPRALRMAVERVTTVSSDKTKSVRLSLSSDVLTVSVASPDNGDASEDVPCQFDGANMDIGFNSVYLREILAQFDGDDVTVRLHDPNGPALFDDCYVLMPMRV